MTEHQSLSRFNGAEAWAKLTPEQQAEIGAIALELVICQNGEDAHEGDGRLSRIFFNGYAQIDQALMDAVSDALNNRMPEVLNDHDIPVPSLIGPVCRVCGCSEYDPCEDVCGWAEDDLCTACVAAPGGAGTPPTAGCASDQDHHREA